MVSWSSPKRIVFDLEYIDDAALMGDNAQTVQHAMDRLAIRVWYTIYGLYLPSSRYFFKTSKRFALFVVTN